MLEVQERHGINLFEEKNKDIEDIIDMESKKWDDENFDLSDYEIMQDFDSQQNIIVDSNRYL